MPAVRLGLIKGPKGDQGIQGPQGLQGPAGINGAQGPSGADGRTPQIQIGTVTTLEAGSNATATITGEKESPVLNLGIPRGADSNAEGDMKASIYDPNSKAQDIFAYADEKMSISGGAFTGAVSGPELAGNVSAFRNILFGTASPSSSLGEDGDIYIQIPE